MTPKIGDLRTVTQRFDGKEWVLCLQSMPPKELSDEELLIIFRKYFPRTLFSNGFKQFAKEAIKKSSEK
jgi:hypothetical protein